MRRLVLGCINIERCPHTSACPRRCGEAPNTCLGRVCSKRHGDTHLHRCGNRSTNASINANTHAPLNSKASQSNNDTVAPSSRKGSVPSQTATSRCCAILHGHCARTLLHQRGDLREATCLATFMTKCWWALRTKGLGTTRCEKINASEWTSVVLLLPVDLRGLLNAAHVKSFIACSSNERKRSRWPACVPLKSQRNRKDNPKR